MKSLLLSVAVLSFFSLFQPKSTPIMIEKALFSVKYKFELTTIETSNDVVKKANPLADSGRELAESAEIYLLFNKNHSVFYVSDRFSETDMAELIAGALVDHKSKYYYDVSTRNLYIEKVGAGERDFLKDEAVITWNFSKESRKINGLTCLLATGIISTPGFTNEKISAWYTEDIPVPFGPRNLYGLPGLILKAEIGNLVYTASEITNVSDQDVNFKIPDLKKATSGAKYYKELKSLRGK